MGKNSKTEQKHKNHYETQKSFGDDSFSQKEPSDKKRSRESLAIEFGITTVEMLQKALVDKKMRERIAEMEYFDFCDLQNDLQKMFPKDGETIEELKKIRRLAKNRVSAYKYRENKKEILKSYEYKLEKLSDEVKKLSDSYAFVLLQLERETSINQHLCKENQELYFENQQLKHEAAESSRSNLYTQSPILFKYPDQRDPFLGKPLETEAELEAEPLKSYLKRL